MDRKEFEQIKAMIAKAEFENAKAQGAIESIKSDWLKRYGTDDVDKIIKIHEDYLSERDDITVKIDALYDKLMKSCDWNELQSRLDGNDD